MFTARFVVNIVAEFAKFGLYDILFQPFCGTAKTFRKKFSVLGMENKNRFHCNLKHTGCLPRHPPPDLTCLRLWLLQYEALQGGSLAAVTCDSLAAVTCDNLAAVTCDSLAAVSWEMGGAG